MNIWTSLTSTVWWLLDEHGLVMAFVLLFLEESGLPPIIPGPDTAKYKIFPNWDCIPANGDVDTANEPTAGPPAKVGCFVRQNFPFQGSQGRFIHVNQADYGR